MDDIKRASILIVEDNALNRKLLLRQLSAFHYDVTTAENGLQALQLIGEDSFDLVLLDVVMPDMDGYEVLQEIRKKWSSLELPVIMTTARNASEDIVEGLRFGANDYVTKPIDIPVTVARIATHLVLRKISQDLRASEQRLSLALNGTSEGIWDWDIINDTVFFSDQWKSIIGYEPDEIDEAPDEWFSRVHPDELKNLKSSIDRHLKNKAPNVNVEHRLLNRDGQYIWVVCRGIAIFDEDNTPLRFAGSMADVTKNKTFDPLTGLPNLLVFNDRVSRSISNTAHGNHNEHAVLLLNLNGHTRINASLGPVASEALLLEAATRISGVFSANNDLTLVSSDNITVTRREGPGYAILMENLDGIRQVSCAAERICDVLKEAFLLQGQEVYSTVSMGITMIGLEYSNYDNSADVMRDARIALGRACTINGNHIEIYSPDMHRRALEQIEIEADLRHSIDNNELALNYQPVINMKTGEICGFEALVRWQRGEHGLIPPGIFIPLAEQIKMIDAIDDWVMHEACGFQQDLIRQGLPSISVAINLSISEIENTDLEARVDDLLERTGIDPSQIEMEVTESIFMKDIDRIINLLKRLSARGLRFSIDDFGTGYSSFAYLSRLPVSGLKIDRSFIRDVQSEGTGAKSIVSSIISMAHKLGLEVIAEGIEEPEQSEFLASEGCDRAQGYYFGRPLSKEDFTQVLADQASNSRVPV